MRIGLLYPSANPLDPNNWSGTPAGLARGLAQSGAQIVPISSGLPPVIHESVAVLSLMAGHKGAVADRMPVKQFSRTRALRHKLKNCGPLDVVIAMGTEMYDLGAVIGDRVPCITYDDGTLAQMWAHPDSDISTSGFPPNHVQAWIERQAHSTAAASLCCVSTSWAADSFAADYGVAAEKIAVVGMGHRPRAVAQIDRDWATPKFLFVGADWERKNGSAVLEAFARVRGQVPAATLHLVGHHPPVNAPGVVDHGFLARGDTAAQVIVDSLYATATCFVLPSRFDPSPISYLEAASAGLPVITTAVGGAGELLPTGGLTANPRNVEDIAAIMLRLCNPDTARSFGHAAANDARTCTWQDVAVRILDAWARLGAPAV